jgi:hypothetical protein
LPLEQLGSAIDETVTLTYLEAPESRAEGAEILILVLKFALAVKRSVNAKLLEITRFSDWSTSAIHTEAVSAPLIGKFGNVTEVAPGYTGKTSGVMASTSPGGGGGLSCHLPKTFESKVV